MRTRNPWRGVMAGVVAATFALGACSGPPSPGNEPATTIDARLTELAASAESFTSLAVGREDLFAHTAEGGAIQIWDLVDGLEARDTFSGRYPAAPFDAIDSEAIQREVEALTHECEDNYRITVNVVTPSAHVTELRCGETSFLELVATAPVRVHLGGTPLPDYAGASVEETWQHVLAQVALLDPDMAVSRIDVDDEQVGIWLAEHSATNDCLPSMSIARDGSEAGWACWSSARGPAIPLGDTTAAELAQLQRDVMTEAGIVGTDGLEATIDVANGVPALAVRQGPLGAEAPLR